MRKVLAVLLALALCGVVDMADAARLNKTVLISYSNGDSLTQLSKWIDITDAAYVVLRCSSTRAAFASSADPDSLFSDSLTAFNVFLSDSVCCLVGGVASFADSVAVPVSYTAPDTATGRPVYAIELPVNKLLRAPAVGSGRYTWVVPADPKGLTINWLGRLPGKGLRVSYIPLRRNTVTGGQSTQGHRVNGLKGFRLWADVYR